MVISPIWQHAQQELQPHLYLWHCSLEASMDTSSNKGCRQRREDEAPSVRRELVMAAVKGKVKVMGQYLAG